MHRTRTRSRALWVVLSVLVAAGASATAALAAAPEVPELSVEAVFATTATLHGVLNPKATGAVEMGDYQFVYRPGKPCKGSGEKAAPPSPSLAFGEPSESVTEPLTGLTPKAEYTVCLVVENSELPPKEAVASTSFKTKAAAKPQTPEALPVSERRSTTATLNGVINPNQEGEPGSYRFLYRQSEHECSGGVETARETVGGSASSAVSAVVENLTPGKAYTYCVKAFNALGESSISPPTTFTSAIPPEEPETLAATDVTGTSAMLHGLLNPAAAGEEGSYEFIYRESASECSGEGERQTEPQTATGAHDEPASAAISGLTPTHQYTACLLARNAAGETALGGPETFTTPAEPPAVLETYASEVTSTSATIKAQLNPDGASTFYRFEYGPTAAYGQVAPSAEAPAGSGTTAVSASAAVPGTLTADTVYHYRLVATNARGTTVGPDETFRTQQAGGDATLIDSRQWELVTPQQKKGGAIEGLPYHGGVVQAAEAGGAFAYTASEPVGEEEPAANPAPGVTQMLAQRSTDGWRSKDLATPHKLAFVPVGGNSEYKAFSSSLSAGLVEPIGLSTLPAPSDRQPQEQTVYLRDNSTNTYQAVLNEEDVAPGATLGGSQESAAEKLEFRVASPDLKNIVVASRHSLTAPSGTEPAGEGEENLYEWSGEPGQLGTVRLASIPPAGEPLGPESQAVVGEADLGGVARNAISNDGSRIVWQDAEADQSTEIEGVAQLGDLFLTDLESKETVRLNFNLNEKSYEPRYQGANDQDTRIFFTDGAGQFPQSDTYEEHEGRTGKGYEGDLYVYEAPRGASPLHGELRDLTEDTHDLNGTQENAGVVGKVIGYGSEGEGEGETMSVYFVDSGVLGTGVSASGAVAEPESPNLYLVRYEGGEWQQPVLIAPLSAADGPTWAGLDQSATSLERNYGLEHLTSGVSTSGRFLAFMSDVSLTGFDNRDATSGMPDEEVFLFDAATDKLVCPSCNHAQERPHGLLVPEVGTNSPQVLVEEHDAWQGRWLAANVPGWTPAVAVNEARYEPRFLSNSGRLFFNSSDGLVPAAANSRENVYEYEPTGIGSCGSAPGSRDVVEVSENEVGGCVGLISSGSSDRESAFLDATAAGPGGEEAEEVFFLTAAQLAPADKDSAFDVYDAHSCSDATPCVTEGPVAQGACTETGSCRTAGATLAPLPQAASQAPLASGNLAPTMPVKAKPPTRRQLLDKALTTCRRKRRKARRISCERAARKRYPAKPASLQKHRPATTTAPTGERG